MNYLEKPRLNQYPNIERFNHLWSERKIRTPIVIMIGGYAGVGKSTLAFHIKEFISNISFFTTGFARAAAQTFIPIEENPALWKNTFRLHELLDKQELNETNIIRLFKEQRNPVTKILNRSIHFIAGEHQNTIIDGNHISPELSDQIKQNNPGVIPIEVYLSVSDPEIHLKMLQAPTHSRTLSDLDFQTARIIHDFIVSEAKEKNRPVFEFTTGINETLRVINEELSQII